MKTKNVSFLAFFMTVCLFVFASTSPLYAESVAGLKSRLAGLVDQNQNASPKVKSFIKSKLIPAITNPDLVKAVKAQNASGLSMNQIKKIDTDWKEAEDELDIHVKMMSGPCADAVRKLVKTLGAVGETFLMDNKGANICQNELTGDYWQGDEAKWKNSYSSGKGGIDIGVEKLDSSTNMVLQQVSLPISDSDGKVIGAITFGLITGKL